MPNTEQILSKLGLSASEQELYLTMSMQGALTASELMKATHMKRPTLYYALKQLEDRGLVHKVVAALGVTRFQAEPPEMLVTLLELKQEEMKSLIRDVSAWIPELKKRTELHVGLPAISFYEGEQNMKLAIMETLYGRSRHIDSLAPNDNFFWQAGQAFSQKYIDQRTSRNITTRNLWEQQLKPEIMLKSYKGLSQVKLLPKTMHGKFRTTMFLYDDSVMYIASKKSGYVLVVKSREHYEMMKALYDTLWEISKSVKID